MLDPTTTKALRKQTTEALLDLHIAEGLQGVIALARESKDWNLIGTAEKEECDYHHMLAFLQMKGTDNERGHIQDFLATRLLGIVDDAARSMRLWHNKDQYAKAQKPFEGKTLDEAAEELWNKWEKEIGTVERYETQDIIFDFIWTMPRLKSRQTAAWYEFISRQDHFVQEHLVGALIMSLWEYMDEEKLTLLTLFSESENKTIHATAMVGFVLIAQKYEKWLTLFQERLNLPEISQRNANALCLIMRELMLIRKSTNAIKELMSLYFRLSKDSALKGTDKETNIKHQEEILEKEKKAISRLLYDSLKDGLDIDLNHKMLLPQSKFLKAISHWWVPFDEGRPQIQDLFTKENGDTSIGIKSLFKNQDCSTNKYALCDMLLEHSKLQQLDAQIVEVQNQMQEFKGEVLPEISDLRNEANNQLDDETAVTIRNKMHNLKRFFAYSPLAQSLQEELRLPETFILIENNVLKNYFSEENVKEMCNLMYEAGYYKQVIPFLELQMKKEGATIDTLYKLSICLNNEGMQKDAIHYLEHARILDESNKDILKFLSTAYESQHKYEEKLDILLNLNKIEPNYAEWDLEIAECLMNLEQYSQALKYLLKIDLMYEDGYPGTNHKTAMCYAMLKNYNKATDYIKKAIEDEGGDSEENYTTAGFVYFEQGMWAKAVDYYQKLKISVFDKHCELLYKRGHSKRDIQLLRDMVLYRQWT